MGRNDAMLFPISKSNPQLIQHRPMKVGSRGETLELQIQDLAKKGAGGYGASHHLFSVDLGKFRGRFESFVKQ